LQKVLDRFLTKTLGFIRVLYKKWTVQVLISASVTAVQKINRSTLAAVTGNTPLHGAVNSEVFRPGR
jgi:hypothetical protein